MLNELESKRVADFFGCIAPWQSAYKHAGLSYFAIAHGTEFLLVQAPIFLRIAPSSVPESHFRSNSIIVGNYALRELGRGAQEIVEQALSGRLLTPHGEFCFRPDQAKQYSAVHTQFHSEGLERGSRIGVLTIAGGQCAHHLLQPRCDWELKASVTPYDSLNELLGEYGLSNFAGGNLSSIEVIATPVCEIDFSARVNGVSAAPAIFLAEQLSPNLCRIGYRVFHQGRVVKRGTIAGDAMRWEPRQHVLHGSAKIEVPPGALLHCVAIYDGHAQHQGWIADPSTVQNPNRAVYEAFDSQLTILRDFLENSQGKGRGARDLEAGVAWLLWMLGFSVAHLGGTAKTQDAPDLIATTPSGNFIVIECTTGLLKADNKLPRLIERAEALRRSLDASGNRHLRVLRVMVTSKEREEVKADLEQAEKLGVVVMTKETLQEALSRTLVLPNAENIYAEGERAVQERQSKYTRQLPLGAK